MDQHFDSSDNFESITAAEDMFPQWETIQNQEQFETSQHLPKTHFLSLQSFSNAPPLPPLPPSPEQQQQPQQISLLDFTSTSDFTTSSKSINDFQKNNTKSGLGNDFITEPHVSTPTILPSNLSNEIVSKESTLASSNLLSTSTHDRKAETSKNIPGFHRQPYVSRHIANVMNHFTGSKEGFQRLLYELDDFLHVLSPTGTILYASPSISQYLQYSPDDVHGKSISNYIHPEDVGVFFAYLHTAQSTRSDFMVYTRYTTQSKNQELPPYVLLEVKGKPYIHPKGNGDVKFIICSGRKYQGKATLDMDSVIELRMENLRLRKRLERVLIERGIDPTTHKLLKEEQSVSNGFLDDDITISNSNLDPKLSSSNNEDLQYLKSSPSSSSFSYPSAIPTTLPNPDLNAIPSYGTRRQSEVSVDILANDIKPKRKVTR